VAQKSAFLDQGRHGPRKESIPQGMRPQKPPPGHGRELLGRCGRQSLLQLSVERATGSSFLASTSVDIAARLSIARWLKSTLRGDRAGFRQFLPRGCLAVTTHTDSPPTDRVRTAYREADASRSPKLGLRFGERTVSARRYITLAQEEDQRMRPDDFLSPPSAPSPNNRRLPCGHSIDCLKHLIKPVSQEINTAFQSIMAHQFGSCVGRRS
jgi:hypothetical protein